MELQFTDRVLTCADCHTDFIFTAGEQLFFLEKQFKNDPKRCKACKLRRSGLAAAASGLGPVSAGLCRTETRTECSACGVETTVPFKPTQGRPVLCRQCFQAKARGASAPLHPQIAGGEKADGVQSLTTLSETRAAAMLSPEAGALAVAGMQGASRETAVAAAAELASLAGRDVVKEMPTKSLPQSASHRYGAQSTARPATMLRA